MKPTIGRIVLYTPGPYGTMGGNGLGPDDQVPAVVVRVWNEHTLNLRLLTDGSDVPWATSVQHVSVAGDNPRWDWPVIERAS